MQNVSNNIFAVAQSKGAFFCFLKLRSKSARRLNFDQTLFKSSEHAHQKKGTFMLKAYTIEWG